MTTTNPPRRTEGQSAQVQPPESKTCKVSGCGNKHKARGYCLACYSREISRPNNKLKKCSEPDCERKRNGTNKFCYQHSSRCTPLRESIKAEIKRQIELVLAVWLKKAKAPVESPSARVKSGKDKRSKTSAESTGPREKSASLKKKPTDQAVEFSLDRFHRSLAMNNPAAALRIIEGYFMRYPGESSAPYEIALKHHEKLNTAEFKKQLLDAVERGRTKAKSSSSVQFHGRQERN